jgi:hypothetical protein
MNRPAAPATTFWATPSSLAVDGGLNPRIFGEALKIGIEFAVELLAARGRGDRSLSTPQAAEGGGRSPSFIGIYRHARIVRRDWWHGGMGHAPSVNIH